MLWQKTPEAQNPREADANMERKQCNAFITARKGFCYLTIKSFGHNHEMMRIRNYKIDSEEKRHMRKLYPHVAFDWKKITQQLAEKREACRRYRSRRRSPNTARPARSSEAFYGVYEPGTRTIYANGVPSTAAGVGALLDAILQIDCRLPEAPSLSEPVRERTPPSLILVKNTSHSKR
jgi:hypothetical protein